MPEINEKDAEKIGITPKKVRLKKNIVLRNLKEHPDIYGEEAKEIIAKALYEPEMIIRGKGSDKYFHFIAKREGRNSPLVLLDVEVSQDGFLDIVHYFKIRERSRKSLIKNSEKVGLPFPT